MKKNLFVWTAFCLIMTLTPILPVLSQSLRPSRNQELKMRVISEAPFYKESEVLIFYTLYETVPGWDSLDRVSKKIIHFQPTSVYVDYLLDTILVNSDFIHDEEHILNAYSYPGEEILLTNRFVNKQKSYLGFLVNKEVQTDTIRFLYRASSKKVEITSKSEILPIRKFDYWLIAAWIIFLYFTLDLVFEGPYRRALKKSNPKIDSFLIIYIIAFFIILFGPSWKIMLSFLIIIYIRRSIIKWAKLRKLAKT